jgi:hypothetical protein
MRMVSPLHAQPSARRTPQPMPRPPRGPRAELAAVRKKAKGKTRAEAKAKEKATATRGRQSCHLKEEATRRGWSHGANPADK